MSRRAREPIPAPRCLTAREAEGLDALEAGAVDLRRDLYRFVTYVQERGLVRTVRSNGIPKTDARRLAKVLSYAGESAAVEEDGQGFWSDYVSRLARRMGLVSFAVEGIYAGYSSHGESFPDNEIRVDSKAWSAYLARTPLEKETALLDALIDGTANEFFEPATLLGGDRFDRFGSATGPASRMELAGIRRSLLGLLASLEPGVLYDVGDLVALLESRHRNLILDPAARGPDAESGQRLKRWEWGKKKGPRPEVVLEDPYVNFREREPGENRREGQRVDSNAPGAFRRVEGRYFEWFLCEVPYLAGFVELAFRPDADRHGLDVVPSLERLRGVRLTPRLFQVLGRDPAFDRVQVTVLPNREVVVEAPSYPDRTVATLAGYAEVLGEDGPVTRLSIHRKKVVERAAQGARSLLEILTELSGGGVPQNVASEIDAWSGHGQKLTFYEDVALVELAGAAGRRSEILGKLGGSVLDDRLEGFLIASDPDRAFEVLERGLEVPVVVRHPETRIAGPPGSRLAIPDRADRAPPAAPARKKIRLESEDLVGLRSSDADLLAALHRALRDGAKTCERLGDDRLVLSASSLPQLRAALRRLSDEYDVNLQR